MCCTANMRTPCLTHWLAAISRSKPVPCSCASITRKYWSPSIHEPCNKGLHHADRTYAGISPPTAVEPGQVAVMGGEYRQCLPGRVAWHLYHRIHPEQAYRICLGLLNLSREYGEARLENACQQALLLESPWRQVILNLLRNHRERQQDDTPDETPVEHSNVRGAGYYH